MAVNDGTGGPANNGGNAYSSENVSPVVSTQTPHDNLTHVGARTDGLPTGSTGVENLVTKAYDLLAHKPLRRALIFDRFASVFPTRQSHNGAVVVLNRLDDLDDDPSTALLAEDYDVLPTPLKNFQSNIVMSEYGRVVTTTNLLRGTSMIPVDPIAAERVGRNAGATLDRLALAAILAGGGIKIDGSAGSTPEALTAATPSALLRTAAEKFQTVSVEPVVGELYAAIVSPAFETALRAEADAAGWRYWTVRNEDYRGNSIDYRQSTAQGDSPTMFQYEGFAIMVNPKVTDAIFMGADGLAKAFPIVSGFSSQPQIVVSPVVDRLRRFASVGWSWLGGYSVFRWDAIKTGSVTP